MKQEKMLAALRALFVPVLRERGFRGSLPHFRRIGPTGIDLLTVQFDRRGGGFIVEVARCGPDGHATYWGKQVPPSRVCAHDIHPGERHRLGASGPGVDGRWFRFDDGSSIDNVAHEAVDILQEADAWWSERAGR
ncbi:MAG TPA: DUF4304 domain-containing protein [Planctomycetota bacterium]|nr:DUF4304 domain-containing protein [Planctomycetota bacterium]